jgi:hypothetical protein
MNNRDEIETLVRFSPDDELVIPLGADSGLVALEVIPKEGGLDSLKPLLEKGVICVRTPIVTTAGGDKSRLLFRFDGPRTKSPVPVGPGLTLIVDHDYIVVPPRHGSDGVAGRWKQGHHPAETPIADLPAKLAGLL